MRIFRLVSLLTLLLVGGMALAQDVEAPVAGKLRVLLPNGYGSGVAMMYEIADLKRDVKFKGSFAVIKYQVPGGPVGHWGMVIYPVQYFMEAQFIPAPAQLLTTR